MFLILNVGHFTEPNTLEKNKTLLIEWVFYSATGHAIEAFKVAMAIRRCNPDMEIWVLLSAQCPGVQLAECLPEIDKVVPIDIYRPRESVQKLPHEWDYILLSNRSLHPIAIGGIAVFREELSSWVSARIAKGICNDLGALVEDNNQLPRYHSSSLRLHLPQHAKSFARSFVDETAAVRISVLLGSASEGRTPPLALWFKLFQRLFDEFCDIEIVLLGSLDRSTSSTLGVTQMDVEQLTREFPRVRNAFDLGLVNQIAIAELCDCHLSPHTGMGIVIQCVGVPWLILSGGLWHVTIFNGVPFWAVYPECEQFPCRGVLANGESHGGRSMRPECRESEERCEPFLCMNEASLGARLSEVVMGVRHLVEGKLPYGECMKRHYDELLCRYEPTSSEAAGKLLMDWPTVMTEDYPFSERDIR